MSSLYLLFCLSLSSKELERDEEDPEELEDSEDEEQSLYEDEELSIWLFFLLTSA